MTTTTDFGAALTAAIAGGYVAQLDGGTYTVTQPIVIHINSTIEGPLGINGGGATLVSEITTGAPVIEIVVGPGVDLRYLDLSNFNIVGNGQEGDGIKIVADGNDRWDYNWNISNVNVSHVGGYGLDLQGSIFEGLVSNSTMSDNGLGGAYIANSADGGVASALRWLGGGFEGNNGPGLTLANGARDMTIDGATIADNGGPGISAMSGITSVTDSTFTDNHGDGVMFQSYGNFNDNTFTTSGSQTVGIDGYLGGDATLVGNTSTYTGAGANPTELANLQGQGDVLNAGNTGAIVTGTSVESSGVGGGVRAAVSVSAHGVTLPTLAPITAATTTALSSSTGTSPLETALRSAFASNTLAHVTIATSYTITTPIVIHITSSSEGPVGIDLGGARIQSSITNGSPVIEIVVDPGVHVGSLTLSNFSILGNGSEGDGIKIIADGTDRSVQLNLDNVDVEHVGGIGLDIVGNVQGAVTDSWMNGNAGGGARFANSANGGVASGLEWVGGGFRLNGVAGMILENGTHDMSVTGAYFVENHGPGIDATSGITSVLGSGFENNTGAGAVVEGSSSFTDDTFSTYGVQTTGIGGYLSGGQINLTGDGSEYYGAGADPTVLANVQGQGTLAISGSGRVTVGSSIAVTGADPVVDAPALNASGLFSPIDVSKPALSTIGSGASVSTDGASLTVGTSGDLVTSDGNWSFGTATTASGHAILLNGQLAANGYANDLVLDVTGHVLAIAADTSEWEWTGTAWQPVSAVTNPGSGGSISADGSTLMPGTSNDLVTSDGLWSFGAATTANGGHAILLNGQLAANGYANELVIDTSGHVIAEAADTSRWEWIGMGWQQILNQGLSADGSSLGVGTSGDLVTSDGTWSFGTATTPQGGHAVLLNGQLAAGGFANEIVVDGNGHIFANAANTSWWEWTGTSWSQVSTDLATIVPGLGGSSPTITVSGNGESFMFSSLNQIGGTIENFSPELDTIDLKSLLASSKVLSGDPIANGVVTADASGTDSTTLHLHTTDGHSYALVTLDHIAPSALPQNDLIWH